MLIVVFIYPFECQVYYFFKFKIVSNIDIMKLLSDCIFNFILKIDHFTNCDRQ